MNCYATVCTNSYVELAKICLNSIKQESEMILPIYCFCQNIDCRSLGLKEREELKAIYEYIHFIDIDYKEYTDYGKAYPYYWSHEMFNLRGYDKVLFLDMDTLIMGSLKNLFGINTDIAMAREKNRSCFNAGVILVGQKYLNDETYNNIKKMGLPRKYFGHDQAIYNRYFKDNITELDKKWNTMITETDDAVDVRILHYILKPNNVDQTDRINPELIELWNEKRKELCLPV
jgi:lipopolysaccharide biosynthesis glycosyltransferase